MCSSLRQTFPKKLQLKERYTINDPRSSFFCICTTVGYLALEFEEKSPDSLKYGKSWLHRTLLAAID